MQYIGNFHPLILHLPIGFLLIAFLMEVLDKRSSQRKYTAAIRLSLLLGLISAVLSATTGYLLAGRGGYDDALLLNHKILGFGLVFTSLILYILNKSSDKVDYRQRFYFPVFIITIILLIVTGHFGGSLTHGNDFLFKSPSSNDKKVIEDIDSAILYSDIISPIFERKCISCHNSTKTKGDLLMSTIEGLKKGGKTGALFVKNDIKNSSLFKRIHLPVEHEEHMPPKGKKQLLEEEITLLEWWINTGASFDTKVGEVKKDRRIDDILDKLFSSETGVNALDISPLNNEDIETLNNNNIPVIKLDENSPLIEINLSRQKEIKRNQLDKLQLVKNQLVRLNLSETDLEDKDLKILKKLSHLEDLHLQGTNITDKSIYYIKNHQYLKYINVYGTFVSDKSLKILSNLPSLETICIWQTKMTTEGIERFRNSNPNIKVNTGIDESLFKSVRLGSPTINENIHRSINRFRDSLKIEIKNKMNIGGIKLYYTVDGSNLDTTKNIYKKPFYITKTSTIKTKAFKHNWKRSDLTKRRFVQVEMQSPIINTEKKTNKFKKEVLVNLDINLKSVRNALLTTDGVKIDSAFYESADIYYTLDGSKPDTSSILYKKPFKIKATSMLKAISIKDGWKPSKIARRRFVKAQ